MRLFFVNQAISRLPSLEVSVAPSPRQTKQHARVKSARVSVNTGSRYRGTHKANVPFQSIELNFLPDVNAMHIVASRANQSV
jgi:hypothetical protein